MAGLADNNCINCILAEKQFIPITHGKFTSDVTERLAKDLFEKFVCEKFIKDRRSGDEKLFAELSEKVKQRQERIDKSIKKAKKEVEAEEKFQKIWDLASDEDHLKVHQSILPSPQDNEKQHYLALQKECEDFLREEVKTQIKLRLKNKENYFVVADEEMYKVIYAVRALKSMGYIFFEDTHYGTWTRGGIGKVGYCARAKLF